jgi:hypothetical protein
MGEGREVSVCRLGYSDRQEGRYGRSTSLLHLGMCSISFRNGGEMSEYLLCLPRIVRVASQNDTGRILRRNLMGDICVYLVIFVKEFE